jgi:hypothetical protein
VWYRFKVALALWQGTVPLNSGHKGPRRVGLGGVGWSGCARACIEPYLSLENPVCLASPCMGLPGACSGPCTHAFKPSSITRHVAGGFVLLVWCIMQIIVTKYSIVTDLRLQSCTLIVEAQWGWLIGAGC